MGKEKVLNTLEVVRAELIDQAKTIAEEIADIKGTVNSSEVVYEMRLRGIGAVDLVDKRFMGAVFRKGWERVGFSPTGSHSRPISIWRKK